MTKSVFGALVLAAAVAHAEPAPPVNLAVTGDAAAPGDAARAIADRLAGELARQVVVVAPRAACAAPCLAVAIANGAATVTFTAATGGTLQRTIDLGADRARWPELVTLLAGNLVRDDAADLLPDEPDSTPAPEAPATQGPVVEPAEQPAPAQLAPPVVVLPPVAAPAPRPLARASATPFALALVPGLSTDLLDVDRAHRISIGLVAGASGSVSGVAISGAVDVARAVSGVQLAGAVAVAGTLTGAQLAGAVAVAGRSTGTQLAGAVATAGRADVEIAGAVTVADDASTQIAGAVTVAGHLRGLQLAPINIARRNDGLQIGVINIGGGPDGDSFGLINIVPGGRTELEATVDSDRIGTVMLRHGGKHWHNVYGVGGQQIADSSDMPSSGGHANDDIWMVGLGVGPSFHLASLPADLEAVAWHVSHGSHFDSHLSMLDQLRLTVAIAVGPVALVAGGALNVYVSDDPATPLITPRAMSGSTGTDVSTTVWPSLFVGARL
jgi:hypothetical protein|nr:hypothetical protein [Kofleriaceae bacterium]